MAAIPPFRETDLQSICDVLGDKERGLTGTQIGGLLQRFGISDGASSTKRKRLYEALSARQAGDRCANKIVEFVQEAMSPVRYTEDRDLFEYRRERLNSVLAFAGYHLGPDGKLRAKPPVSTLDEAEERAGKVKAELRRRGVHPDVLVFCRAELMQGNYFHAVFEATKSVADKVRNRTGLRSDGSELVDQAFGLGKTGVPLLAFNSLRTEPEQSEHRGLANLMRGMFGTFRNVTAHAPKVSWNMTEQDALDLLTIASFLHRRLDDAIQTGRPAVP